MQRASECQDPFDRFFAAWIALVILARADLDEKGLAQPDADRKAIIQYFESHALTLAKVLVNLSGDVVALGKRKGSGTGMPLLDVQPYSPPHLREVFDVLAKVWAGAEKRKDRWVGCATAEMVNHIRNNVFHGVKAPDDANDRELLEHVNAILMRMLETGEARS
jgi:hypothetical protein